MTDHTGKVYEHLEYFPFGETFAHEHSNTQRTPCRFIGKEYDEVTVLYYYGARYYDPRTSVWQSPDPILESYMNGQTNGGVFNPKNLSLFSYSMNNPVNLVDPDGNAPRSFSTKKPKDFHPIRDFRRLVRQPFAKSDSQVAKILGKTHSRTQLRSSLGLQKGDSKQGHHIIPVGVAKDDRFVKRAIAGGFDFNGKANGVALKPYKAKTGEGDHGNHPAYDTYVKSYLKKTFHDKKSDYSSGYSLDAGKIMDKLEDVVVPHLKGMVDRARKSDRNLNDYFRAVNKQRGIK